MAESTRPAGAPGAGGGGVGSRPASPSPGASRAERRRQLMETVLLDRRGEEAGRQALRMREDLRVPNGLLLVCARGPADLAAAGRVLAGRLPRAVAVEALDDAPPHVAVVLPVGAPTVWQHALGVAAQEAESRGCLVLARPAVTGLRALRALYQRAVADAGLAVAGGAEGPLLTAEDLVMPRMLALLDAADQRALVAPIQPILAQPPAVRSGYLRTLEALRRCGGVHARAAAMLSLHVNSVRYRIGRIEELTRLRVDDPADRMRLDLAVMLVMLRGLPPTEAGYHELRDLLDRLDPLHPLFVPGMYADPLPARPVDAAPRVPGRSTRDPRPAQARRDCARGPRAGRRGRAPARPQPCATRG